MDASFPVGFPAPTAFYLVLYMATFAIHQAFVHYVVAGSIYVAWATVAPGRAAVPRADQPLASMLRDWLPFVLGAAITAGVAPLLFVQITYPRHFYTANLLLAWRWMIVIPVLIVAFYLLYLVKSSSISQWPYAARAAVVLLVVGSFLFVGFCWTANHLISNGEADWARIYSTGPIVISWAAVALRMLVWIGGACASMAVIASWQLAAQRMSAGSELMDVEMRRLAWFSLAGLAMAGAAGTVYLIASGERVRDLVLGPFAIPYAIMAVAGLIIQMAAWSMQLRAGIGRWLLAAVSFGWVLTLVGASVLRESVRWASIDISTLYQRHAAASAIGGLAVFLAFALLNAVIIAGCVWLVRRGLSQATSD